MKKCSLVLIAILLCIIGADNRQVKAYSVKLQKDGIYAEVLPDLVVNNVTVLFEKEVKKALKYYKKYKDADTYTLATKVPAEYLDFIPVARKIQDSDEIIIRNPFYIYNVEGYNSYSYCFIAEKNGERLCMFNVFIDQGMGEVSFRYDNIMDGHFLYDEETMKDVIFYKMDNITYVQTPEETSVVWDQKQRGVHLMVGADSYEAEMKAKRKAFKKKNYEEKKEEIFSYLNENKDQKVIKEAEKNLKLELKDDYIETEKNTKEGGIGKGVSIVSATAGVVVIVGITTGIIFRKRRKRG
ncbi:hypothetical protein D7V86_24985 [bacterium D16-51]|nr:hypothetical protein D7V96_25360 [bacterium D16-59]RKI53515.1 hypothetical protein D7V86_24985 [bacterium D16-51]